MRARALLLLVLIYSLFCSLSFGQESSYKLQAQDVIRIQVLEVYASQINAVLPIGRDGNVSAPFVGMIHAAGKTTNQLETELIQLYEEKLKVHEPHVSVTIEQFRSIQASVNGMVTTPGVYDFRPGDTIMTLISKSAGVNTDRADMRHATLKHRDSRELIPIDLHAMLYLQDMSQNYEIQDGDELNVPEDTSNRILILGAISAPGAYPFKEPMHLADAVALAKGPIPIRTMLSKVTITRPEPAHPGQFIHIKANFVRFIKNGDNSQNVELHAGDLIYIGETSTPDWQTLVPLITNTLYLFGNHVLF
jgi:polysaccharide export outer membrane protein